MHVCTIIAKNYVAYARVLARSFAEHHPEDKLSVLVIDDFDRWIDPSAESFELLTPAQIGCDEFDLMASRYDVLELSTAVKPWLLRHLLSRGIDAITYLDPDIKIFGSLTPLRDAALQHGLSLIPHNTSPIPFDGERPTQIDIMIAGTFNLGYITLAVGPECDRLLDWWSERLLRDCRVDPVYGYFVDQRWMDLIPGLMSDYAVIRDPEFNLAYWNLHARRLQHDDRRYLVDGRPLAFFHFSGFDPDHPDVLSRHQTRIQVSDSPALGRICGEYARDLLASGHDVARNWPYGYGQLADGTRFGPELRRLFRAGEDRNELFASPFEKAGCEAFMDWLTGQQEGAPAGVSRLSSWLYEERDDLKRAFPDVSGSDRLAYLQWAEEIGMPELGLAPRPGGSARAVGKPGRAPTDRKDKANSRFGVNVVGYFRSELGVGEAGRQVVAALDTVGVPLLPLHGSTIPHNRQGHAFTHLDHREARYPFNLICMNADALPEFAHQAGAEFFEGRYSIGLWFWEVAAAPPDGWRQAFELVDEVWAPSAHVAHAVSAVAPVPTIRIPLPVEMPPIAPVSRAALDLPNGDFVFLFSFDYRSVFERKNPLALVEAFCSAFRPRSGATLIIKSINAESDPANRARLHDATAGRPDIRLHEHYLAPDAKNALTAACDCYVSLHRAEGFGLTMAEAMLLGKPVIATGYSGNLDFMRPWNSYLVDHEMVGIGADATPYPAEGEWAQPSVTHAAQLMREVFEHRDDALERGRRGAADIRQSHSPAASGEQMIDRLRRARALAIGDGRAEFTSRRPSIRAVAARVARGPMAYPARNIPRKALRRVVLRTLQPFTMYQLPVNAEMLDGLTQLDRDLDGLTQDLADSTSQRLRDERLSGARERAETEQLRQLRAGLEDTTADVVAGLNDMDQRLQVIEAERRAIPFMQDAPFDVRHDPIAGAVLGYNGRQDGMASHQYRSFEDVFRGSEEMIRGRQGVYLPIIGSRQPVLDFGCGRGELLDLMRDGGITYLGVDSDESMVARCHEKGHDDVIHADGLEYLEGLPDRHLGAIVASQVIEHLTEGQLRRLLTLARRKLAGEGILIAETVNPHSPPALKAFWVDLTHHSPVFPEVALELCREAGFGSAYIFHPNGTGDVERDRFTQGEFAVVASVEAGAAATSRSGRPLGDTDDGPD